MLVLPALFWDKIFRGQFDSRVRKYFMASGPDGMDAHDRYAISCSLPLY